MTLQNAHPLRFSPVGLSDALAEEDAFPGACAALTNLVPDPTTKNLWTPRPASVSLTSFGTFTTPTGVTVCKIIGSYVYGMVSSGHFAGKDEPFVFNLLTNTFVSVTGVNSGNIPTTQSTSGDWTPPTMDAVGVFIIVTHPGFDGVTNFIGWFDTTVLSAPVWNAGNFSLVTPVVTVNIAFPGSGYANGTYTNVPLLDGMGAGATANITVAGGVVTVVTIVNGGVGYTLGDTLTVNNALIGGGTGFVATVATIMGSGIANLAIIATGNGYTSGYHGAVSLDGGKGSGATGNFVVVNGSVVSISIANAGQGYLVGDLLGSGGIVLTLGSITAGTGYTTGTYSNIFLTGGTGSGATANITVNGSGHVSAVTLVRGGVGYTVSDVLGVSGGGAEFLNVTYAGSGTFYGTNVYTEVNQLHTSGSGTGIAMTVTTTSGFITNVAITNPGQNYAPGDSITIYGGGILTIVSVMAASPIGAGTGFAIPVATASVSALGAGGTGFVAQVITLTNPGGFINFTTVPSWVRQFNGRGWFGINPTVGIPSVIFSDVYALNATNANQALSFGDNTPLTAAAPLGLANLLGGVVQSLIVFKSLNGIIQITGDATTNNLTVNQVPGGSGTISPRSVTEHPQGLLYLDHDGYRMVTLDGNCTDPIGVAGSGVVVPFLKPLTPSRVAAGCNGTVLRVSVDNSLTSTWQEYWYDTVRKCWSGPHTFPSTMYETYEGDFVTVSQAAPAHLFSSTTSPNASSVFTENGTPLTWTYQTVVLQDNEQMAQSEIAETQVKANDVTGLTSITVAAIENGSTINSEVYTFGSTSAIIAVPIDFNAPVVYNRLTLQITGASKMGFRIGDIYVRARTLGYRSALF